eukprot:tig00000829_g4680.t1
MAATDMLSKAAAAELLNSVPEGQRPVLLQLIDRLERRAHDAEAEKAEEKKRLEAEKAEEKKRADAAEAGKAEEKKRADAAEAEKAEEKKRADAAEASLLYKLAKRFFAYNPLM